jgi:hypothetical protein
VPHHFGRRRRRRHHHHHHHHHHHVMFQTHGPINSSVCLYIHFNNTLLRTSYHNHFYDPFPILFCQITIPMHCSSQVHCILPV